MKRTLAAIVIAAVLAATGAAWATSPATLPLHGRGKLLPIPGAPWTLTGNGDTITTAAVDTTPCHTISAYLDYTAQAGNLRVDLDAQTAGIDYGTLDPGFNANLNETTGHGTVIVDAVAPNVALRLTATDNPVTVTGAALYCSL